MKYPTFFLLWHVLPYSLMAMSLVGLVDLGDVVGIPLVSWQMVWFFGIGIPCVSALSPIVISERGRFWKDLLYCSVMGALLGGLIIAAHAIAESDNAYRYWLAGSVGGIYAVIAGAFAAWTDPGEDAGQENQRLL
jgi:hypothetical protein